MPATLDLTLEKRHYEEWKSSAVSDEIINKNVMSIVDPREVNKILGKNGSRKWGLTSDLVPAWYVSGVDPLTDEPTLQGVQVKPDKSPIGENGKPTKYIGAKGMETAPLFLRNTIEAYWKSIIDDLSQWIFICEGAKKAGSLLSINIPAISIPGVTTCRKLGRLHQNLLLFAKPGRNIVLAYDNDLMYKKGVQDGLEGMGRDLRATGAKVWVLLLPEGEAKGVDDFLALHGETEFRKVIQSPESLLTFEEWLDKKKELDTEQEEKLPKSKFGRKFWRIQQDWGKDLRYNSLKQTIELKGETLDPDELQVTLFEHFDMDIGKQDAYTIVRTLARRQSYSPVVDYLNECEAKFPNIDYSFLDNLAHKFFGTDNPLHGKYFKNFLVASVARARVPGCWMDCALLLTSGQGVRKSTFWETLYGKDFFSDDFGDGSDKDEKMKMHRFWCLEWSEFETVYKRKDVAQLKNFMARDTDTYRAPYDIQHKDHLRRFVFCGTSNETEILNDPTGSRRFWPIPVTQDIPIEDVAKMRDRIWAAANALYKTGYKYFLSKEEESIREELNEEYQVIDPWHDTISRFVGNRDYVTVDEIYHELSIEPARRDIGNQRRITAVLKRLGLKNQRIPLGGIRIRAWVNDSNNNGTEKNNLENDNFAVPAVPKEILEPESHTQIEIPARPLENQTPVPVQSNTSQDFVSLEVNNINSSVHLQPQGLQPIWDSVDTGTAENFSQQKSFESSAVDGTGTEVFHPVETPLEEQFPIGTWVKSSNGIPVQVSGYMDGMLEVSKDGKEFGVYAPRCCNIIDPPDQVVPIRSKIKNAIPVFVPGEEYWSDDHGMIAKVFMTNDTLCTCSCDVMVKGKKIRTDISYGSLKIAKGSLYQDIKPGDKVEILSGPKAGKVGIISSQEGDQGPVYVKFEKVRGTRVKLWGHQFRKVDS